MFSMLFGRRDSRRVPVRAVRADRLQLTPLESRDVPAPLSSWEFMPPGSEPTSPTVPPSYESMVPPGGDPTVVNLNVFGNTPDPTQPQQSLPRTTLDFALNGPDSSGIALAATPHPSTEVEDTFWFLSSAPGGDIALASPPTDAGLPPPPILFAPPIATTEQGDASGWSFGSDDPNWSFWSNNYIGAYYSGLGKGVVDEATGARDFFVETYYVIGDMFTIGADPEGVDPSRLNARLFHGAAQTAGDLDAAKEFDNHLVYSISTLSLGPLSESGYDAVVTGDSTEFSQQAGGFGAAVLVPYAGGRGWAYARGPLTATETPSSNIRSTLPVERITINGQPVRSSSIAPIDGGARSAGRVGIMGPRLGEPPPAVPKPIPAEPTPVAPIAGTPGFGSRYELPGDIANFAERFEPLLDRAVADQMRQVGVPEDMIGRVPGDPGSVLGSPCRGRYEYRAPAERALTNPPSTSTRPYWIRPFPK